MIYNKPVLIKSVLKELIPEGLIYIHEVETLEGDKIVKSKYATFNEDMLSYISPLYSITLDNGKKMILYKIDDLEDYLFYAILASKDKIEVFHLYHFLYDSKKGTLIFSTEDTRYETHYNKVVVTNSFGKKEIKAIGKCNKSSFDKIFNMNLTNISPTN